MKSKAQHWVPQLYLRHFATPETRDLEKDKRQVFAQNWGKGNGFFKPSIKNISAENYLYTPIDEETGERNWKIDDRLQEYEALIGKIWPHFLELDLAFSGEPKPEYKKLNLPQGEVLRQAITMFIVQLFMRNPFNKEKIKEIAQSQIQELEKLPKDEAGIPKVTQVQLGDGQVIDFDPSDWHQFKNLDESLIEKIFLDSQSGNKKDLYEIIYNKKWRVIVSENNYFITCDRPIAVVDPSVGLSGSVIYFPLSPQRCLMLSNEAEEEGYFNAVEEHVPLINCAVIRNAGLQTYSHRDQIDIMRDTVEYHEKYLQK